MGKESKREDRGKEHAVCTWRVRLHALLQTSRISSRATNRRASTDPPTKQTQNNFCPTQKSNNNNNHNYTTSSTLLHLPPSLLLPHSQPLTLTTSRPSPHPPLHHRERKKGGGRGGRRRTKKTQTKTRWLSTIVFLLLSLQIALLPQPAHPTLSSPPSPPLSALLPLLPTLHSQPLLPVLILSLSFLSHPPSLHVDHIIEMVRTYHFVCCVEKCKVFLQSRQFSSKLTINYVIFHSRRARVNYFSSSLSDYP